MNKKYAILVVDMLNDFVTGALGCDNARAIVKPTQELLEEARKNNVPVIFCNDSHLKGIDKELDFWGDHAIRGTKGADVIPEFSCGEYLKQFGGGGHSSAAGSDISKEVFERLIFEHRI